MSNKKIIEDIMNGDMPKPQKLTIEMDQLGGVMVDGEASYSFVAFASGALTAMTLSFVRDDLRDDQTFAALYFLCGLMVSSEDLGIKKHAFLNFCNRLADFVDNGLWEDEV